MRNHSALVGLIALLAWGSRPVQAAPRAALVKGLDISVYSGNISPQEVSTWMSLGYSHVVVGSQNTSVARQQLATAVAGGMTVDVYVYLYFSSSMSAQVDKAVTIANGYPVGRIWLDIEDGPSASGLGVSTLTGKIQEAINACGTMPYGIYTGSGWWNNYMRGSTAFSSVPLWFANWDYTASLDTWSYQSFGGWSSPMGKQYQGDTTVGGVGVDTNVFRSDVASGGGSPPPAGATSGPHVGTRHESQNLAHRCGCSTIPGSGGAGAAAFGALLALAAGLLRKR